MTEIKRGTHVLIPKGATIFEGRMLTATRKQVVKVESVGEITTFSDHDIHIYLTQEELDEYRKISWGRFNLDLTIEANRAAKAAAEEKYRALARSRVRPLAKIIRWGTRWTYMDAVTVVEDPKPKKERTLTFQQQLVKGSVWRFKEDIELFYDKVNPQYWQSGYKGPRTLRTKWDDVKAGETITVTGKTFHIWGAEGYELGVPFTFSRDGKEYKLPISLLKPLLELVSIPVVEEYVLRDTKTGEFYKAPPAWYRHNGENAPDMVETFMSAKRFPDMGKLKIHILGFCGYYDGLPGSDFMPEWAGGGKKLMDLPEHWEVVKFDKLQKQELEVIDIQSWYKRTWELRALTVQFGSPVRKLFNDIEKRGELAKYKGMLVIRMPVESSKWGDSYEDEASPEDIAAMKDLIDNLGLKKGEYRMAKDNFGAAVTFKDASQALIAKLKYQGNLKLNVINLDKMAEVVGEGA